MKPRWARGVATHVVTLVMNRARFSPLAVGDSAPPLSLQASTGKSESVVASGRATLVYFFRGKWCPFCNTYLEALAGLQDRLLAVGSVRTVTPDSLVDATTVSTAHRVRFPILSDPDLVAIDAFGVRHDGGGPAGRPIPRPAIFVIAPDGRISYAYIGKNPLDRPLPEGVLAEVEKAAGAHAEGYAPGTLDRLRVGGALVTGALKRTLGRR